MDWIPLFAGGAVIYGATTWVAGRLLRRQVSDAGRSSEPVRRARARANARDAAPEPAGRTRFSIGLLNRAPVKEEPPRRKAAVKPVPPEPFDPVQRQAVNRQVAAKIEQAAAELKPGIETLAMDQAVTQPIAQDDLVEATREAHELVGKIQSLDFTLDEKDPMGDTAIVDVVTLDVSPLEDTAKTADIGATLLLDTEDLLKAIRGGPAGASSDAVIDPIAIPAATATAHFSVQFGEVAPVSAAAEPLPPVAPDWESALQSLRDAGAQSDAAKSFFDGGAGSRDMGTTQLFRLDGPLVAPRAPSAPERASAAPVGATADSAAQFAAPDMLLDFSLPDFASPAAKEAPTGDDRAPASHERAPRKEARRPRRAAEGIRIRHPRFHRIAVAHDDIQAARVAFEGVLDADDGAGDPAMRALVFGALVAYGRPFQDAGDAPIGMKFSSERFAVAHEELLAARERLLGAAHAVHDQVLRIDGGDEDEGATFAVHTELLNDARLPMYVALCNFLEAQLLDLLQEIGEDALEHA